LNSKEHFDKWGWISFLSFIAESKVFDRYNGKNSIDNAKEANLYQVLIYASEKKDNETMIANYYKSLNK